MIRTLRKILFCSCLAGMLSGCEVGPDYRLPDIGLPPSWAIAAKQPPATDEKAEVEQQWWTHFHDPVLDQLVARALNGNPDLQIAQARLAEARGSRRSAGAALFPSINGKLSDTRQANRFTFGNAPAGITKPFNTFEAGFDASWELDLFGGAKRAIESSRAQAQAAQAQAEAARVTLLAEVARNYVDIRQYQAQLSIIRDTIKTEENLVAIVGERYRGGQTSELDLTQAKAQLEQLKTQLPYYENLQAQAEYATDVLLGEQPGAAHAMVAEDKPVPVTDAKLVLAAPANVIAGRPDIRAAERQLAAATAQQGVAVARFFPDISLSGFVGLLNTDAGNLLERDSKSWSGGAAALLPILNYGRLAANLDVANAKQQEALATYRKSVIGALADVAKSVTAYVKQGEFQQAQARTVKDNRKTRDIARERYKEGLSSFIDVLDAQRTLYQSESRLVQSKSQTTQELIAVYKSLGGGWKE